MTTFSNLPPVAPPGNNSVDSSNNYYDYPYQLDAGILNALSGFFENKGFDQVSARSISSIMMIQSLKDNINPMTILDSLSGFSSLDLSTLATQILNYNRFKSSYLGISTPVAPMTLVQRNVLA